MWNSHFNGRAVVTPAQGAGWGRGAGRQGGELYYLSSLHILTHSDVRSLQEEMSDYHLNRRVRGGRQGAEDVV